MRIAAASASAPIRISTSRGTWRATRSGPNRDPFAHFLRAGTYGDRDPSPDFDAAAYRKRVLGRRSRHFRHLLHPERDNPLVHWLGAQYAAPSALAPA